MIGTIGDRFQQRGVIAWLRLVAARQLQTQLGEHGTERGNGVVGRFIVNTEQRRLFCLLYEACRRDVGEDHALFNQLVRVVTLRLLDTLNAAFGVENELRLFALKGDAAALCARLLKGFIEGMQLFNVFYQRRVLFAQFAIALQHMPHLGVGQTRVGAHHRFVELISGQTPFGGDGHLTHHTEAVYLRIQGAEAIGEHFRQHWNNLRREVDGGAAITRFVVQRRTVAHVIANIGDGNP